MTGEEAVAAMKKANSVTYKPADKENHRARYVLCGGHSATTCSAACLGLETRPTWMMISQMGIG